LRQRDGKAIAGQVLRIVGAATKTAFGLVPIGNTARLLRVAAFGGPDDPTDAGWRGSTGILVDARLRA
jgi:hypothetical protein